MRRYKCCSGEWPYQYLEPAAIVLICSIVIGCGGGSGENSSDPRQTTDASGAELLVEASQASDSLAARSSFSDDDIRHFLARTHFVAEPGKVEEIRARGLAAYLDEIMHFAPSGASVHEQDAALLLANDDDPPDLSGKFPSDADIFEWNIQLLIENPNAFQEVMGMFWQDHFGVDVAALANSEHHLMVEYINLLRSHAVGDFRELFLRVGRSGAMLIFLDGADNNKFAPNENFAREFWELFSLGVDNGYSDLDIIESSRAFTGWRRHTDDGTGLTRVIFDSESKAVGSKTPLGSFIPHDAARDDYSMMVDLTLMQNAGGAVYMAAQFLARRLLQFFVLEEPSDALVDSVAVSIADHNYELVPVLKQLFLSEAFYADTARTGLVRNLYEQVVGLVRATGLEEEPRIYRRYLQNMDSLPGQPPSVEGWPDGDDKITVQGNGLEISNFVNELITNRSAQSDQGYDIGLMLQPSDVNGPESVIDYIAELLGVALEAVDRDELIEFMNTHYDNSGNETPLNYTPANKDHQDRKLRNLLWILCQHPSFQTK